MNDPRIKEWTDKYLTENTKYPDLDYEVSWMKEFEKIIFKIKIPKFFSREWVKYYVVHEFVMETDENIKEGNVTFNEIPEVIKPFIRWVFKIK